MPDWGLLFAEVAGFNGRIGQVLALARQLDLVAINAMLLIRRSDRRLAGFHVVASALRAYSRELGGALARLAEVVHSLTQGVAAWLKQTRLRGYFHGLDLPGRQRTRERERAAAAVEAVITARTEVREQLARVTRLARKGRLLARNAAIEAARAGTLAPALGQVAGRLDEVASVMADILADMTSAHPPPAAAPTGKIQP